MSTQLIKGIDKLIAYAEAVIDMKDPRVKPAWWDDRKTRCVQFLVTLERAGVDRP